MWCKVKIAFPLFLLSSILVSRGWAELLVGGRLPPLENFGLEGNLPADREGHVMLVDFWASWCEPCKQSFPTLGTLQDEFASKGLIVIGVGVDEKPAAFSGFVKRMSPRFAVVRDGTQKLVSEVKVPAMPSSYIIDRRGVVRFVQIGFHEDTEKRLRAELTAILEEKP